MSNSVHTTIRIRGQLVIQVAGGDVRVPEGAEGACAMRSPACWAAAAPKPGWRCMGDASLRTPNTASPSRIRMSDLSCPPLLVYVIERSDAPELGVAEG